MLKVGLTGSIAVGKSFVCDVLRENGCHVLDSDVSARKAVERGSRGLREVVKAFGSELLTEDGDLNRKRLAQLIFANDQKRILLNSIVHPRVLAETALWLEDVRSADSNGIAIVDAALMIESGSYRRFDKIIVVWCDPAIQLKRLMLRDKLSEIDAKNRIAAQLPQDKKKDFADHLIDTSNGFDDTRQQTMSLLAILKHQII